MKNNVEKKNFNKAPKRSILKSLLLALPMILITFVMMMGPNPPREPLKLLQIVIPYIGVNVLFFLMVYTGKTDKYRAILFVTMALSFPVGFILNFFEARGHLMMLTAEDLIQGNTPFCHIGIPQTLLPAVFKQEIIFPGKISGSHYSIGAMLVLWLGTSLVLGRGLCSWFCFFGGWEDGCARLRKNPRIKNFDRKWTYLPFALLLAIALTSALTLSPQYCEWLCPFKAVSEFGEIASLKAVFQTILFVALFLFLVIALPILTKRRTQCAFFCPLGATQSFTNKISPFDIRIDPEKCAHCKRCIQACPVFSLDEGSLKTGRPSMTCVKCGKCVDICPTGAITYHIKGTAINVRQNVARMLFLYPAFLVLAIIGGGMFGDALYRLLLLVTTGNIVQ